MFECLFAMSELEVKDFSHKYTQLIQPQNMEVLPKMAHPSPTSVLLFCIASPISGYYTPNFAMINDETCTVGLLLLLLCYQHEYLPQLF